MVFENSTDRFNLPLITLSSTISQALTTSSALTSFSGFEIYEYKIPVHSESSFNSIESFLVICWMVSSAWTEEEMRVRGRWFEDLMCVRCGGAKARVLDDRARVQMIANVVLLMRERVVLIMVRVDGCLSEL